MPTVGVAHAQRKFPVSLDIVSYVRVCVEGGAHPSPFKVGSGMAGGSLRYSRRLRESVSSPIPTHPNKCRACCANQQVLLSCVVSFKRELSGAALSWVAKWAPVARSAAKGVCDSSHARSSTKALESPWKRIKYK